MNPRITWSVPASSSHAIFATWDNRLVFASVVPSSAPLLGEWLVSLYPSGSTAHARLRYVASEHQAKRFVERWADAHADAIGVPAPMPKATY